MGSNRLDRIVNFCRIIDNEKNIIRHTYISNGKRLENDAEHSWHLAMMTLLLSDFSNEKIDILKTISIVLVHDLVEIYAGDTFAYDTEGLKTQKTREKEAADRLFSELPDDLNEKLRSLWEEFETGMTPEARFAHTLDNFQPMMLQDATDGKSWKEDGRKLTEVLKRNRRTAEGSGKLWNYAVNNFIIPQIQKGHLKDDISARMETQNVMSTKRLILRPWNEEDANALYELAKDPAVGHAAGWLPHGSVKESLEIIRRVFASPETYAVVLKETGSPVGCIGLLYGNDTHSEEIKIGEVEIGYWIGVPYWGKGLIPEAMERMLERCFEDLGVTSVWGIYYSGNHRSRRVLEKSGFEFQHSGWEDRPAYGPPHTVHYMKITVEKWRKKQPSGHFVDPLKTVSDII